MSNSNTVKKYFDLHISGLGYLNRIREVTPKKGSPFLACDIAALSGDADDASYTRFDCRVSGAEAQSLVRRCRDAVEAEKKVLIGFKLGDLWGDIFTYSKGKKAGQQDVSFKARLLFVSWIKVDGHMVYQAPKREGEHSELVPPQGLGQQVPAQSMPQQVPDQAAQSGEAAGGYDTPAVASF
ncbi:STY4534 family ICE replication protein [Billgrantia desiderata]|uniref:STY4534 family ICE replication protein n=1 Tax=Billgrantia desiderata TaxID=52021 RepID=UPI00089E9C3A|nr:STY4534 family ICE replication protein [Halomonas desiderata]SEG29761.1 Protein of unknown function [Halomonas desiderata]